MEVALERKVPCSLNCGKGRVIQGGDLKFTFRRILSSCLSEERGRRLRGGDERKERGTELGNLIYHLICCYKSNNSSILIPNEERIRISHLGQILAK